MLVLSCITQNIWKMNSSHLLSRPPPTPQPPKSCSPRFLTRVDANTTLRVTKSLRVIWSLHPFFGSSRLTHSLLAFTSPKAFLQHLSELPFPLSSHQEDLPERSYISLG